MLLAGAVGFAFGGTILYAYYQSRLDKVEQRVADYIDELRGPLRAGPGADRQGQDDAKEEIRREIEPIKQLSASGATLAAMINAGEGLDLSGRDPERLRRARGGLAPSCSLPTRRSRTWSPRSPW